MMPALLGALLLVQPLLEEPGSLRLVATGTRGPVTWIVDGREAGTTLARQAMTYPVEAGPHAVVAQTQKTGPWQIAARLESAGPGISFSPTWTASGAGDGPLVIPHPAAPLLALLLAGVAWRRRPAKRP